MANLPIQDVEGIGAGYAAKLRDADIKSTDQLLEACKTPKGRKALAAQCDISPKLVLKWANMCDLFRVKGVAGQNAELLEAAGVDTVKELRTRNAENLAAKMKEVNESKKLVRQVPGAITVQGWIDQAKELPPTLEY